MKSSVRSPLVALALACALSFSATRAHGTTVVPITLEQLAQRADVVVLATVRSTRALWQGRLIVTDCELEVRLAMKGTLSSGQMITLRVPGGVLGDLGQVIPGVPRVDRGDTIVVFATRAEDRAAGRYYLTHLTASILPVVATPAAQSASSPSATLVVRPAAEGMIVQGGAASEGLASLGSRTAMPRGGLSLENLVSVLRASR